MEVADVPEIAHCHVEHSAKLRRGLISHRHRHHGLDDDGDELYFSRQKEEESMIAYRDSGDHETPWIEPMSYGPRCHRTFADSDDDNDDDEYYFNNRQMEIDVEDGHLNRFRRFIMQRFVHKERDTRRPHRSIQKPNHHHHLGMFGASNSIFHIHQFTII